MVGLRRRQDALGPGKLDAGFEAARLRVGAGLDQPELLQEAHQRGHPMVSQSAGVEAWRHECRTERVHFYARPHTPPVPPIISSLSPPLSPPATTLPLN